MAVQPQHTDNIVLGAGLIFFDKFDDNGNPTGQRYLGQTPGFTLNITSERLEHSTSDGPIAVIDVSVTTSVTRTATIVCDDMSAENFALFIAGDVGEISQSSATGESDALTVSPGRSYQLGQSAASRIGAVDVSNVTVTDDGTSTAYTEGTDYVVDEPNGRVEILASGTISAGTDVTISYDVAAATITTIKSSDQVKQLGSIYFVGDNTVGENRKVVLAKVEISPEGDLEFKSRENFQQITLNVNIQEPAQGEAIEIYG